MFRRFILCVAVVAGLAVAGSCSTAEARGCYRRSYSSGNNHYSNAHRSTGYYHGGHHTYYRSAPVVYHRGYHHGYRSYPVYYGGHHGANYGGSSYGHRSGISFSVGF